MFCQLGRWEEGVTPREEGCGGVGDWGAVLCQLGGWEEGVPTREEGRGGGWEVGWEARLGEARQGRLGNKVGKA